MVIKAVPAEVDSSRSSDTGLDWEYARCEGQLYATFLLVSMISPIVPGK